MYLRRLLAGAESDMCRRGGRVLLTRGSGVSGTGAM